MMEDMRTRWMLFLLVAPCLLQQFVLGNAEPQVPCFFIFGDSLADNGNNDDLPTSAKANYKPYGIDFPGSKPGRFTNGRTTVDFLAEHLGFDHPILPHRTAKGSKILRGINYASGSAGIRAETGQHLGTCIDLKKQVQNHKFTVSRVSEMLKNETSAVRHLNKCLYTLGMGSNDYINNYFVPQHYGTSKNYSLDAYAKDLIRQYSEHITTLYHYGARKIALFGVGQIGCTPSALSHNNGTNGCVAKMNVAAKIFNNELKSLVDTLNKKLSGTKFVFINVYGMAEGDPSVLGFKVLRRGCCEVRSDGQCSENKKPCANRAEHVFWDSFHPTEAVNQAMATRTYAAFDPTDAYPFDLSHLVQLDLK